MYLWRTVDDEGRHHPKLICFDERLHMQYSLITSGVTSCTKYRRLGMEIAAPKAAREILVLKGGDRVGF